MVHFPTEIRGFDTGSLSKEPEDNNLRTTMEVGASKVRRRYTAKVINLKGMITVNRVDMLKMEMFYDVTTRGGVDRFLMTDPFDLIEKQFRFKKPMTVSSLGAGQYRMTLEMEIMP